MNDLKRIVIIGTSSSGKTTLAKSLAKKLDLNHKELDGFFWEKNWQQAPLEIFNKRVQNFAESENWVTDGNFSQVRDILWPRATTIIWLNYSLPLILKRFFIRSIKRSFSKEELWSGNRESIYNSIIRKDSLLVWILKSYKKNKKNYRELQKSNPYSRAKFIELSSPQETNEFLSSLTS